MSSTSKLAMYLGSRLLLMISNVNDCEWLGSDTVRTVYVL